MTCTSAAAATASASRSPTAVVAPVTATIEASARRWSVWWREDVVGRVRGVDQDLGTRAPAREQVDVVRERSDGELADLDLVEAAPVARPAHDDLSRVHHAVSLPRRGPCRGRVRPR